MFSTLSPRANFLVRVALTFGAGLLIAMYWSSSFSIGAWFTGSVLLVFAVLGRAIVRREHGGEAAQEAIAAGALRRR